MKRIITVQDISCVGKCSLTVALPIISAMGVEACVLPTAVLSTHTAFKGFTFRDLKGCSPKAGKTKRECAKAITYILDNKEVLASVLEAGRMPAKEIEKQLKISLKLLDRYRRYIIMAVVILNGEYPLLADYLQYIRKDAKGS